MFRTEQFINNPPNLDRDMSLLFTQSSLGKATAVKDFYIFFLYWAYSVKFFLRCRYASQSDLTPYLSFVTLAYCFNFDNFIFLNSFGFCWEVYCVLMFEFISSQTVEQIESRPDKQLRQIAKTNNPLKSVKWSLKCCNINEINLVGWTQ